MTEADPEPWGRGLSVGFGFCAWRYGHLGAPAPHLRPWPCPAGGPEEQWQRAIHERGEAVCPTCNVVTRKTLVGLKKHMEVCQKVGLPPGSGGEAPQDRPLTNMPVCSCRMH